MSIRTTIIAIISFCIFFLSSFFLILMGRNTRIVLNEVLSLEARHARDLLWSLLSEELEEFQTTLGDYARWTDMGEKGVKEEDLAWLEANLNPWVQNQFGYEVILVKRGGKVITVSPGWIIPYDDLSEEPWVGTYGDERGLWIVASCPVTDETQNRFYDAWLCFAQSVDAARLGEWSKRLRYKIEYRSLGKASRGEPYLQERPEFSHRQGKLQVSITLLSGGEETLGEFLVEKEYIGPFQIYVTVWRAFMISLSVVTCVSLLAGWMVAKHILLPLKQLSDSVARVSQGDYDLVLEVERKDEIGEISRSFARMATIVKRREESLGAEKREAERLAMLDALTQVPNRRFLESYAEVLIKEGKRFSLVFLDLDEFKRINDSFGHTIGDHLLRETALWFEKNIRKEDVVVRYGGDEFCLIFPELTRKEVEEIMERLSLRFMEKRIIEGLSLGFSYGIAVRPDEALTLDALIALSDREMYAHKLKKRLPEE